MWREIIINVLFFFLLEKHTIENFALEGVHLVFCIKINLGYNSISDSVEAIYSLCIIYTYGHQRGWAFYGTQ